MIDIDEILEKRGLKYDDLTPVEKETYSDMLKALEAGQLTVEKLKDAVYDMKQGVEDDLVKEPEYIRVFIFKWPNPRNTYLKARLKNYMTLEALLTSPERAEKMITSQIGDMNTKLK